MTNVSLTMRQDIIAALRNGVVPSRGLEHFATGLERFDRALDAELQRVATGNGVFKAARGEYGSGKTFFSRWLQHRARSQGFATAEVQISETETPLHRLETVYRHLVEHLETKEWRTGAFRKLIDKWFLSLEDAVLASGSAHEHDPRAMANAVGKLLDNRLRQLSQTQPQFAACLRSAYDMRVRGDYAGEEGLFAWLAGQPNIAASVTRSAGLKGRLDHTAAAGFMRGLLLVLGQTGKRGLVLVLDEVETIQRMQSNIRRKALNALRQLIDDVSSGRFPGLYLLITGTPLFFEGPRGIKTLQPLYERIHVAFDASNEFDSTRAVQIRLRPFDHQRLVEVGSSIRALYPADDTGRLTTTVSDAIIGALAKRVVGTLGGKTGIAPRLFLKKLVDLLDKVDEYPQFDPVRDYKLRFPDMNELELVAAGLERSVDDIELDLMLEDTE